ncbi:cell division cycle 7-related protein kinase-like [Ciona intestinalis]
MMDFVQHEFQITSQSIKASSSSYPLKEEDFHDESSLVYSPPSPILNIKGKEKLTKTKMRQKHTTDTEFSSLFKAVPQIKEHFIVERQIGCGTFSNVYLAKLKNTHDTNPALFALKHIFSTSHPKRIENEIKCLKDIGGELHVVGVEGCIRNNGEVVIIMPYIAHDKFAELLNELSLDEIRDYMRKLLESLLRVHQFNVIHRDVKPNNFLYDRKTKRCGLVDFGLAQELKTINKNTRRKSLPTVEASNKHTPPNPKRRCLAEIQQSQLSGRNISKHQPTKTRALQHSKSHSSIINCSPKTLTLQQKVRYLSLTSPNEVRSSLSSKKRSFTNLKTSHNTGSNVPKSNPEKSCSCFGKLSVCKLCLARPAPVAPRAGTSGFRPPEVLLKYQNQTTAVDIWSAGVIFLSLLSGRCPFFRPSDDVDSLAQLTLIFGSKKMADVARICGRTFTCSNNFPGYDLKGIVVSLRDQNNDGPSLRPSPKLRSPLKGQRSPVKVQRSPAKVQRSPLKGERSSEGQRSSLKVTDIPDTAFTLLSSMLDCNPHTRYTALQCLNHEFFFTTS